MSMQRVSRVKTWLVCITLLLSALIVSLGPFAPASGSSLSTVNGPRDTTEIQIERQTDSFVSSLDAHSAIERAHTASDFQSATVEGFYFNSIYETFHSSVTSNGVMITWDTVNVVYSHNDRDGTGTNYVI